MIKVMKILLTLITLFVLLVFRFPNEIHVLNEKANFIHRAVATYFYILVNLGFSEYVKRKSYKYNNDFYYHIVGAYGFRNSRLFLFDKKAFTEL